MCFRAGDHHSKWILLALSGAWLSVGQPARSATDVSLQNFTITTVGVTPAWRFDTAGNGLDAHDGGLSYFNGVYYLYGTSYNCGFQWLKAGSRWCGFKVYSSPDLLHWQDNGFLFDPTSSVWQTRCGTNGCFRPHMIYNANSRQYILWANFLEFDIPYLYRVFQSSTPNGPFSELALPTVAFGPPPGGARNMPNNGDFNLFLDDDGQGYIVYTAYGATYPGGDLFVERLNSSFTSGSGQAVNLHTNPAGVQVEAPAMFKRGPVYYILYSPACAYCTGAATRYLTSTNPLGPWINGQDGVNDVLNPNSCGGQPTHVATIPTTSGQTWMYMSDLWFAPPPPAPQNSYPNQARASQYWAPLNFDTFTAGIQPFTCSNSVTLDSVIATPGHQNPIPDLDQTSGTDHFATWCDIGGSQRIQSFVSGRSGVLTRVSVTTFRGQALSDPYPAPNAAAIFPNADLQVDITDLDLGPPPGRLLKSFTVPAASIGFTPGEVVLQPQMQVQAGHEYGISLHSKLTQGCYGMAYNDANNLYPAGREFYSGNKWSTFLTESHRALKFDTSVTSSAP